MASREEKKAQTRRKLLDAAAALVAKQGAVATSLDQIAEKAGLTKGAIYSNFGSKDELIWALADDLPSIDLTGLFDPSESLADNLERLGEALALEISKVSEKSWYLALEITNYAQRNARTRRALVAEQQENQAYSAALFEQLAKQRGEPLPLPGADLNTVIDALAWGLVQKRRLDPRSVRDDLLPKAFRLLAGG